MAPVFSQLVERSCPTSIQLPSFLAASEAPANLLSGVQPRTKPIWSCQGLAQRLSNSVYLVPVPPQGPFKERYFPSRFPPLHSLPNSPKSGRRKGGPVSLSTDSIETRPIRRATRRRTRSDDGEAILVSAAPGPSKTCEQCMRAKTMADFERSPGSQDGRSQWCRACMAVFEAERWERKMHHLGLSVEEAWERGKQCTECGLFKELRDFARNARLVEGVGGICRGCRSDMYYALPKNRPTDQPQECTFCHESKPASEFFKRKDGRRGLHSHCKACIAKRRDDLTRELQSREVVKHVPKMRKLCGVCMENKPTTEFLPRITSSDGLMRDCKPCQNAKRKLIRTKRTISQTTQ